MTLAGVSAIAGACLIALGGMAAFGRARNRGLDIQIAGVCFLALAGLIVFWSGPAVGADFRSGIDPALGLDPLSGFYLVVLCVVAAPALLFARASLPESGRSAPLIALTAAFVLSMAALVAARDVSTFLVAWELMTLTPAAAMLVWRQDEDVRGAVIFYVGITHVAAVGVWVAMLTLSAEGVLGGEPLGPGGLRTLVLVSALVGFLTKAGIAPFHVWLPRAHPVAPSHISALMSGVMIMLGVYGLSRVLFLWVEDVPSWVGVSLVGLGSLSALVGVLYALVQRELKRLLAFSSIEHAGIVVLGIGAAVLLDAVGQPRWAAIAFAGALLQILNHAAFKGALFLGAGAIGEAAGTLRLDRMGGLLHRMPLTGGAFAIAAFAIAGLPLLNGFVSEWISLQALLRLPVGDSGWFSLVGALGAATLAATAGLAALCFIGVAGVSLLGRPRTSGASEAAEPGGAVAAAIAFLASLCLALALLAGVLVPRLSELGPGFWPGGPSPDLNLPDTGSLPTPALVLALALLAGLVAVARGSRRAAPAPVWISGQPDEPQLAWTLAGFTKPLRLMADGVLRTRRESTTVSPAGIVESLRFRGDVPHLFDTHLFAPLLWFAARGSKLARRLQSGSLRAYLGYLMALLLFLLLILRLDLLS